MHINIFVASYVQNYYYDHSRFSLKSSTKYILVPTKILALRYRDYFYLQCLALFFAKVYVKGANLHLYA